MSGYWLRGGRILAVMVLASAVAVSVPTVRQEILQSAGRALVVHEQPIQSVDLIVVAIDTDGAGTLEAADLVRRGVGKRVAVFADSPDPASREFVRRGVPYESAAAVSIRQLRSLGVTSIEEIPRTVDGSQDEGQVLPVWCDLHNVRSVVVVTTSDHSRRLRRMLKRSEEGHQTNITVRSSLYSEFNPDRWWQTRGGIRTEIIEIEKLLLDLVLHPIR